MMREPTWEKVIRWAEANYQPGPTSRYIARWSWRRVPADETAIRVRPRQGGKSHA